MQVYYLSQLLSRNFQDRIAAERGDPGYGSADVDKGRASESTGTPPAGSAYFRLAE